MGAWTPITDCNDVDIIVGVPGGSGLSADTAPNSAMPDSSRVSMIPLSYSKQQIAQVVSHGGTATVVGWVWSNRLQLWVQIFSQALSAAGVVASVGAGISTSSIPDNVPFFPQISVAGSGLDCIAVRFH
jgi:hypothetical protein